MRRPSVAVPHWMPPLIPPGPTTARHGGNTSCVEILAGKTRIVLDAGTGLRSLGNHLLASGTTKEPLAMTLLLP